jgi:hypothetical protein
MAAASRAPIAVTAGQQRISWHFATCAGGWLPEQVRSLARAVPVRGHE